MCISPAVGISTQAPWHLAVDSRASLLQLLCSLTSTGFYKEIAKFGKAAAQPFKDIQTSLNDTFATLGSLSVAPKLSSMSNGIGGSPLAVRRHNTRMAAVRRTQSVQLEKQISTPRTPDAQDSSAMLIAELRALHAAVKESTSLVRLDLQQHTALQVNDNS